MFDGLLLGLFAGSFLAATLLPMPSEVLFVSYLLARPDSLWLALAVATAGNTLGGMTTYLMGRMVKGREMSPRALKLIERWGPPALLLSWLPILGDALCGVAGWLRMNALTCMVLMAIGKGARYAVLALVTL